MVLRHLQFRSFTSWRQTSYESSSAAVGCTEARLAWLDACSAASQSVKSPDCDFASDLIDSSTQQHSSPSTLLIATYIAAAQNCFQTGSCTLRFDTQGSVVHQMLTRTMKDVRMHPMGAGNPSPCFSNLATAASQKQAVITCCCRIQQPQYHIKTTRTSTGGCGNTRPV